MPFTISHAVLAPPLARLSRGRLPIAALAIGCMVPDLIRFFVDNENNASHQWSALIYPNMFIGLFFSTLWYVFYRPMLYQFFALQDQIHLPTWRAKAGFVCMLLLAILLGTATHLLWDGFTHADARTLFLYDQLSKNIQIAQYRISVHMLLQLLSSAIPLPIIGYMIYRYAQQYRVISQAKQYGAVILLGVVMCGWGVSETIRDLGWAHWQHWREDPYHTVGDTLVAFFKGAWLGLTLSSVVYVLYQKIKQRYSSDHKT